MSGFWRAVIAGAVVGVLVVGGLVAAIALGLVPGTSDRTAQAARGPVLIALVLPDAEGLNTVRTIELFESSGGSLRTSPVDPLTSATVPGTSATTLAEAYAFGGGERLATAFSQSAGGEIPLWVVIEPQAWSTLTGTGSIPVTIPADIEVFDGKQLYSYAQGDGSFPAEQVSKVMDGADHLTATERAVLREAVGDALLSSIVREGLPSESGVSTNLTAEELATWLSALKSTVGSADTNQ